MSEQGIRSVVGNLVTDIRDHGIPGDADYPAWLDRWCDKLLKTTGYYRERERSELAEEVERLAKALDDCQA